MSDGATDCLQSADAKVRRDFALELVSNDDTIFMCASTEQERDQWIAALGQYVLLRLVRGDERLTISVRRAIVKHSSLLIMNNDDDYEDDGEEGTAGTGANGDSSDSGR